MAKPPRAWQRMLSGRRLDLLDPTPVDVEIEDIAHGLAFVARWNGQTLGDWPYSVVMGDLDGDGDDEILGLQSGELVVWGLPGESVAVRIEATDTGGRAMEPDAYFFFIDAGGEGFEQRSDQVVQPKGAGLTQPHHRLAGA